MAVDGLCAHGILAAAVKMIVRIVRILMNVLERGKDLKRRSRRILPWVARFRRTELSLSSDTKVSQSSRDRVRIEIRL